MTSLTNLTENRARYESEYASVQSEFLIGQCRNIPRFLDRVRRGVWNEHVLYNATGSAGDLLARIPGATILELGSGNGMNALVMAALGAKRVIAVDLAAPTGAIAEAVDTLGLTNFEQRIGDLRAMDFDNRFDIIFGQSFLHHLTDDLEDAYLARTAALLKPDGEARFAEPAQNHALLATLQFLVPGRGRPSSLNRRAFQEYWIRSGHPRRSYAARHYRAVGERYFGAVDIIPFGALMRFERLIPKSSAFNYRYREWAYTAERRLPQGVQMTAARRQAILLRHPLTTA